MDDRRGIRILAWALWGVAIALSVIGTVLLLLTLDAPVGEVYGVRGASVVAAVPFATMGALLASRRQRNPVGWLFLTAGVAMGFGAFGEQYGVYSVVRHGASLPLTEPVAWLQNWMWVPLFGAGLVYPFLLFPDGRLPSPRWRWVPWFGLLAMGVFTAGIALEPGPLQSVPLDNPLAIGKEATDRLTAIVSPLFLLMVVLSLVALARRYRRSRGDEREQMKWLLFVGTFAGLTFVANLVVGIFLTTAGAAWKVVGVLTVVALGLIPVAAAVAVLKYRLYDIEIVIRRTLAYSILAGFLTAAYVGVIVGVGALVGRFAGSSVVLPIAATAVAAAGFQPVRQRARGFANRRVYGKRTSGYEALKALAGEQSLEDFPPKVARLATESTAARRSVVWLSTGLELEPRASWPADGALPDPVPLDQGQVPESAADGHLYSLIHQGDLLGAITVRTSEGERLPAEDNRLLSDLAAQAATALRGILEAVELPEGIVTFLMTDVEGSTRLWQEDAEAMGEAMRVHDPVVQRTVNANGGVLMKWRGEGDSTFSVFPEARDALSAASALQAELSGRDWPTPRPLRVRASLHTGQAELRGRDYFGQAVNRCARVRAVAEGGQILVSAATRELVRDRVPDDLVLHDLGERELKDLGPERVYEVRTAVPGETR